MHVIFPHLHPSSCGIYDRSDNSPSDHVSDYVPASAVFDRNINGFTTRKDELEPFSGTERSPLRPTGGGANQSVSLLHAGV